jgi:hypothetical protein
MEQTSDVMEVKGSPMKLIGLFAAGVLMTTTLSLARKMTIMTIVIIPVGAYSRGHR